LTRVLTLVLESIIVVIMSVIVIVAITHAVPPTPAGGIGAVAARVPVDIPELRRQRYAAVAAVSYACLPRDAGRHPRVGPDSLAPGVVLPALVLVLVLSLVSEVVLLRH